MTKFYDKEESLDKTVKMIKESMKIVKNKMSKNLADAITVQGVMLINNNYLIPGDCTISKDLTQVRIRFNINLMAGYVENEDQKKAYDFIMTTVRHECLHAFQWLWIARKAGHRGINKMRNYISTVPHSESILEKGAEMYENEHNASLQNFDEDLAMFIR